MCISVFFHIHNNAKPISVTLFFNVAYAINFFVLHHICHLSDEACFVHLIWKFCDNNSLPARRGLFNFSTTSNQNSATACFVSMLYCRSSHDDTASWIVRRRDDFDKFVDVDVWVVDKRLHATYNLFQVVRRNVCCHTNCNAVRAVHKKIWEFCRKHSWLHKGVVEVRIKVHCFFVDVLKHK